jgi:hypothetical protein
MTLSVSDQRFDVPQEHLVRFVVIACCLEAHLHDRHQVDELNALTSTSAMGAADDAMGAEGQV